MITQIAKKLASVVMSLTFVVSASAQQRWEMCPDGSISWNTEAETGAHYDHIEMSGRQVSAVLRYGVDEDGKFSISKSMVYPLLRTIPNNTHASLMRRFGWNPLESICVGGRTMTTLKTKEIRIKGMLIVKGEADLGWGGSVEVTQEYLPSTDKPALVERYTFVNTGNRPLLIEIPESRTVLTTPAEYGVTGSYEIGMIVSGAGNHMLMPQDTLRTGAYIAGYRKGEPCPEINVEKEYIQRASLVESLMDELVLTTPDPVIDRMFAFSKIRACESIYATQGGPMHGPGGESYYAAIWANDQAEYINPYFPFVGYEYGNESALNSFRHFARFMNDRWEPIPSSIVAEGLDIWNGVGDRGDAAMIAYGASRYALSKGSREEAVELWPLIEWCLEYCRRNLNEAGVVSSDTDELENRFPSGDANLCTSSLYYDALLSASFLGKEIGKGNPALYRKQAMQLRKNMEAYFGSEVEGFHTYAYYKGNDVLRSWICIPLTVGIDDRKEGTIQALFSPRLWTENGLLTQAGSETFWDRSTLYALRGVYAAGETEKATGYLHRYSSARLLGDHVPYAIEAWPEGEQRHLSAESGLYGRIVTEGIFGIRPTGLRSFSMTPRLPLDWPEMSLKRIHAFGSTFDISVARQSNGRLRVSVTDSQSGKSYSDKVVPDGGRISINLSR